MKIGFTIAEMFYFQLTEKGRGQVIDNPLSKIKHQNTCLESQFNTLCPISEDRVAILL